MTKTKTVKQELENEQPRVHNQFDDLPCLIIKKSKGTNDFMIDELFLSSTGWTMQEALYGMDQLIKKLKDL